MPDMFDPDVGHVVLLPQWARRVSAVHADAVQHRNHSRHPVPVVPVIDDADSEHVGHGPQTGRGVRISEGGVLQPVVRVYPAGASASI